KGPVTDETLSRREHLFAGARVRVLAAAVLLPFFHLAAADSTDSAELVGLWRAQHDFGPYARGALILEKTANGWAADFRGRRFAAHESDNVLTFDLPGRDGGFRAHLQPDGTLAGGQWFQPASPTNPPFGTGITFKADGPSRWRGDVVPLQDTSTFYLMLQKRPDGSVSALLRNREFNLGVRYNLDRLVRDGNAVRVIGRLRGETADRVLLNGHFEPDTEVLTLAFDPPLDGAYDFRRAGDESDFYPRARNP